MTSQILKFELEPKIYGIFSKIPPHPAKVDSFTIFEKFKPNPEYAAIGQGLGDYQLIIEREIESIKELQNSHFEISAFVSELDRAWMYSCGHPLTKKDFAFMTFYAHFPNGELPGWSSNYIEVEKAINKGRAHATFSFKNTHNASFSYWPLEVALNIRRKYLDGSDQAKALVDLHYYSHKVENGYSMLFFLAKALELVRALLPGNDTAAKEEKLPKVIRGKLKSSFNHILGLSNNRYEIRHIVKDPKESTLHPQLTSDEINIFKNDADLIIRGVVCMELDVPLLVPSRS